MKSCLYRVVVLLTALLPAAAPGGGSGLGIDRSSSLLEESEFLPVDQAFQLTASRTHDNAIRLRWQVMPGYYLYRHRLAFEPSGAKLGEPEMARGQPKVDEYFGKVEVYYDELVVDLPLIEAGDDFRITVGYQGCADRGLCYPPQKKTISAADL